MKKNIVVALCMLIVLTACAQQNKSKNTMNYNKLSPEEENVIIHKGTERPYTGKYYQNKEKGTYTCKRCNAALYNSSDKFESNCGWPSFNDEIKGAVKRTLDADGSRTEITCSNCGAHLGHVFEGENLTKKDIRHCVNSISLNFIPASENITSDTAIFAGGCFWGVEYFFQKENGVLSTEVGYIGGKTENPSYQDVCMHTTGHAEAARIIFDPKKTTFEKLARLFFEIHDPTQLNRQGPDAGDQYRSEIFYFNPEQQQITENLIQLLKAKGLNVVTKISPATKFWKAEEYHQQYYEHKGSKPYCHGYVKRF
ncbi:MAG: bifunctional methionine sulfoxide reductase B/A protein [Bacteroidales bacterium]